MSFTVEQIRGEALRLSAEDRARLARELIESLDELEDVDQAAVDAAWAEEVERRLKDFDSGRIEPLDGEQVMRGLNERFRK
jgi:putative addiction module component (TIGR02574 family)